jgi:iron complex outermembrane recepter protein
MRGDTVNTFIDLNRSKHASRLGQCVVAILAAHAMSNSAGAQAPEDVDATLLNQVVVTGTRVADRTRLDTLAPVDVMTVDSLSNQGTTELAEAISTAAPSLNFPRPSITDGTDHIRPATLRGLAPDQTLVLVNSKRRHQSALVNVNGSVGRGSAAVDLNAIPLVALSSVEVLRDGASAQYGSDAIAGVINLRLREAREGGGASVSFGRYHTTVSTIRGERDEHDGETLTVGTWAGLPIGSTGSLTLSAEYRDREPTSRGDFDDRVLSLPVPETLRVTSRYGDAEVQDLTFYANAVIPLNDAWSAYSWLGFQQRDGESAAFPRLANNANNLAAIYPNGFLPIIATDIKDVAAAFGVRGAIGPWDADFSVVYGRNDIDYRTENSINGTLNATLGAASPTSFDSGGLQYDQITVNAGLVRGFDWGFAGPTNIAVGIEARRESYSINAGELNSYQLAPGAGAGTAPGAQGFPGFQPANEVDEHRTAIGIYGDAEVPVTEQFLTSVAIRAEDYSDFGSALTGKLSARYDFFDSFAIRATASNGFRAPGLQQEFFTSTATNFVNGLPVEVGTFPASSQISQTLGSQELDAEKSLNFSQGIVVRFTDFEATLDGYFIKIKDRIVLSENLGAPAGQANVRALLAPFNVGAARFFINGVDTKTKGVDLVVHKLLRTDFGKFDFTLAGNWNKTEVTRVASTAVLAALSPAPPLFDRVNRVTFEEGTPDTKVVLMTEWKLPLSFGSIGAGLKATRYGEVTEPGLPANSTEPVDLRDIVIEPRVLVDVELRTGFLEDKLALAIGADNVFDQYPAPTPMARPTPAGGTINLNSTNALAFSRYSPFGFNGRFIYLRASYNW